jgi:hypothetical protein
MWELRRLTTLRASTAFYRDSFTFYRDNTCKHLCTLRGGDLSSRPCASRRGWGVSIWVHAVRTYCPLLGCSRHSTSIRLERRLMNSRMASIIKSLCYVLRPSVMRAYVWFPGFCFGSFGILNCSRRMGGSNRRCNIYLNKMSTSVVLNELPSARSAHALRGNLFRNVTPRHSISVFQWNVGIKRSSSGGGLWGWTKASHVLQPRILAPCPKFASCSTRDFAYFLWCIPCYIFSKLWVKMNASPA